MSRLPNRRSFRVHLACLIVTLLITLPPIGLLRGTAVNGPQPVLVEPTVFDSFPTPIVTSTSITNQGRRELPVHSPAPAKTKYPHLQDFIDRVSDGRANVVRGVYVPQILALTVIQQPEKNRIFVSNKRGRVTQFASAARSGVTALLAHNYLSGKRFYDLLPGQEIIIVYGDRRLRRYRVTNIHQFQRLNPSDLSSNLFDLNNGEQLTSSQAFHRFYRGKHRLIFQTCLAAEGRRDWGLTFIVAEPVDDAI